MVNSKVTTWYQEDMEGCGFTYNYGTILVQTQVEGIWQSFDAKYNFEDKIEVIMVTSF